MWSISKRRGAGPSAMFVQVARAITDDIRRGALQPGDRLPSTRALATQFAVNRNTIVAAYDELVAQGWVVTRGAGGTFVSAELPERHVRDVRAVPDARDVRAARATRAGRRGQGAAAVRGVAARPGYDVRVLPATSVPFGSAEMLYHLSGGVPDTRLLPSAMLSRAYRRVLRSPAGRAALDYADPHGAPRLRTAIAAMLRTSRGIPATADNILITRGSQMALDLATRLLVRPGQTVAVEELGYRPAWRAFEEAGARLEPIALDGSGLVVDELAGVTPRCIYVTPHHQYPTTVLMSPARRMALLDRARRERFAILEDDYDHEFHFEGRPVAPLAADDPGGNVIYLGTLSKILAPGLRLGFVAAPEQVIDGLARLRTIADRQGDQVLELAVADLIEEGELQRHAKKMRRVYEARRDALVTALRRELAGALSFQLPAGGITLWAKVAAEVPLEVWCERARARGVAISAARDFALDGKARPYVRLAYARYRESELLDAVRRLRDALPRGKNSTRLAG
ncbi:MAG: PLP-dependent aminotransferase family protein [Myxococcales bacterium]|nr:PLP-dependent aminotransferase family protein [Myxococcales bacterium]